MTQNAPVLIGGTIGIDTVKTPSASAERVLGGSASFAALSCAYYSDSVHLIGRIGEDFPKSFLQLLEERQIDLSGVERSSLPTFSWSGEYLEGMAQRETLAIDTQILEDWELKVPISGADAPITVLANMSPLHQLQMIEQLDGRSRFVIADTMDFWISTDREEVHEMITKVDCLVINEGEAKMLSRESNLVVAGRKIQELGAPLVIIKVGEFGAYLFAPQGELYRIPAYPITDFVDPTGAGDAFLGGLAGYLSQLKQERYSVLDIRDGMLRGSINASYTCEGFSVDALESVTRRQLEERLADLHVISCW